MLQLIRLHPSFPRSGLKQRFKYGSLTEQFKKVGVPQTQHRFNGRELKGMFWKVPQRRRCVFQRQQLYLRAAEVLQCAVTPCQLPSLFGDGHKKAPFVHTQ